MRELLQQALEALSIGWDNSVDCFNTAFNAGKNSETEAYDADMVTIGAAQKAIEAALSRSEWVPVAERLPVVPEGSDYVVIWCWKDERPARPSRPWSSRWYDGFSARDAYFTHWMNRQDDTPAPPEGA